MTPHILTFDVEDWFHVLDVPAVANPTDWNLFESRVEQGTYKILDLLDEYGFTATFFVLGWIAHAYPNVLKEIKIRGHDIGSHSYYHKLVYQMSSNEFEYDLKKSIDMIAQVTNCEVVKYRAPGFSVRKSEAWFFESLCKAGIHIDSSIFASPRAHGGYPSIPFLEPFYVDLSSDEEILELPVVPYRRSYFSLPFSGGGYFRLLSYKLLKLILKQVQYSMWYFHPRDIDPKQPRLNNLSLIKYFKTYVGLAHSEEKLSKLLSDFNFWSIAEFEKQVSISDIKRINLNNMFV